MKILSDDKKNQETGERWESVEAEVGEQQQGFAGGNGGCKYMAWLLVYIFIIPGILFYLIHVKGRVLSRN